MADERAGGSRILCHEPWENYYILRRGILPCCYGWKPIAPMSDWRTAWNAPDIQEIRAHLAKGKLSPYCLLSLTCPIVQRHMEAEGRKARFFGLAPGARPPFLRFINRQFGGIPAKIYRWLSRTR
jgi:hypothetical protein